jgi:SAM-dependent methyltransferase
VLEHIDADEETLRFLHSILLPGGVLVLTVPAHPFLFDEMDRIAHHRRRYRGAELRDKLRAAGFEIRLLTHFMAALVPSLLVVRSVGRLFAHRLDASARRNTELRVVPFVNGAMSALVALERYFVRWRPLSFGTSILAVARRGDG